MFHEIIYNIILIGILKIFLSIPLSFFFIGVLVLNWYIYSVFSVFCIWIISDMLGGMYDLHLDTECAYRAKLTATGYRFSGEMNSVFQNIAFDYINIGGPRAIVA